MESPQVSNRIIIDINGGENRKYLVEFQGDKRENISLLNCHQLQEAKMNGVEKGEIRSGNLDIFYILVQLFFFQVNNGVS